MPEARLLGFIALAVVLLLIYQAWITDHAPPPAPAAAARSAADIPPAPAALPEAAAPDAGAAGKAAEPAGRVRVRTDVLDLDIDLAGGTLVRADLLAYPVDVDHPDRPVRLLDTEAVYYVAQSGLRALDGAAPDHRTAYRAAEREYVLKEGQDRLDVELVWQGPHGIEVLKRFVFHRGDHLVEVVHEVHNRGDAPWRGFTYRQLVRDGSRSTSRLLPTYTGAVIYSPDEKYQKLPFDKMAKAPLDRSFAGGWAAYIQHYFLSAWLPPAEEVNRYYTRVLSTPAGERYLLGLASPAVAVAPGASARFESRLYLGPKLQERLAAIAPGLELTVDYGYLTIIAKPLFHALKFLHGLFGNWGWAIIALTVLIKLLFYKLSEISYRSMANMRRLQPKIQALQARYKDDRQRLSQAMMELYRKEKINPLGGCLPMLVQIPVFIALYWVLLESVELRQSPWILWIRDLSSRDPYFILPLIMGATMFVQNKLNPAPPDPLQARLLMAMPIVFTVFFAFFPAGLVLYWVTNSLLTIAQQWYITRRVLAADKPG